MNKAGRNLPTTRLNRIVTPVFYVPREVL